MKVRFSYDGDISTPDMGQSYFNCQQCLAEKPEGTSPQEWSRQQTALTPLGFQVWCVRHNCNIANVVVTVAQDSDPAPEGMERFEPTCDAAGCQHG